MCMRAVTASVLAISMVPRQGDNLIRLFSASRREEEWRETGRRGPAFPAACLSLPPPPSPSLKLLLIKQSGATEAGPFHALCWDQRRLFGNTAGLANRIRTPGWQASKRPVLMRSEAYSFDLKHVPCRLFVLCRGWLPPASSRIMGPETRMLAALYFLAWGLRWPSRLLPVIFRALQGSWAFICLEHVASGSWK